ncbi:MAG: GrpB family protein [Saprospiraceae bacterium]|nr:GrpB family protein [Saprospiraceae bacterium]
MKILLTPYDPAWPVLFHREYEWIAWALQPDQVHIEHIGSTSVPDLPAKPVIDVLVGLATFDLAPVAVERMVAHGFTYLPQYEDGMPFRRLFIREVDGKRISNVHTVEFNTPFWRRHLAFRDHLRSHPEVRDQYAQLKLDLSQKEWDSVNDYAQAKTDFIRAIEAKILG